MGLNPMVGTPAPELMDAWLDVADTWGIDSKDPRLVGYISSPGPKQRLVVVDRVARRVAKTSVFGGGRAALETEVERVGHVARDVPMARSYYTTTTAAGRLVLESPQLSGVIPRWTDISARRLASSALALPGDVLLTELDLCRSCSQVASRRQSTLRAAVWHGDFVAWNVRIDSEGRAHIFDWEFASPDRPWPLLFNEIEWIVRGAAAARTRLTGHTVRRYLASAMQEHGAASESFHSFVQLYLCLSWRNKMTGDRARDDALLHKAFEKQSPSDCASWREWQAVT